MQKNYKQTFDEVSMGQERNEQIRDALSTRYHELRKDDILNTKPIIYKTRKIAFVAAAIALISVLLLGFAYGAQIIDMLSGGHIETSANSTSITVPEWTPVEVRDERVYFVLDGSGTDITSYCTDETFFQYERMADNGSRHVVIVGGYPDNLGWAEFIWDNNNEFIASSSIRPGDNTPIWYNNARVELGLGIWLE